jgi:hypothetical protein
LANVPLQLKKFSDSDRVWSKAGWICCECLSVNQPAQLHCLGCDKQRWSQLKVSATNAAALQKVIRNAS